MEPEWFVLAVLIPSASLLVGVLAWGWSKVPRGMDQMAQDSGWKRIGWGAYLTGSRGDAYEKSEADAGTKSPQRFRPVRRALLVTVVVFCGPTLSAGGGAAVSRALGDSELAGAIVGLLVFALLIGTIWIVLGATALRSEIARRHPKR